MHFYNCNLRLVFYEMKNEILSSIEARNYEEGISNIIENIAIYFNNEHFSIYAIYCHNFYIFIDVKSL